MQHHCCCSAKKIQDEKERGFCIRIVVFISSATVSVTAINMTTGYYPTINTKHSRSCSSSFKYMQKIMLGRCELYEFMIFILDEFFKFLHLLYFLLACCRFILGIYFCAFPAESKHYKKN